MDSSYYSLVPTQFVSFYKSLHHHVELKATIAVKTTECFVLIGLYSSLTFKTGFLIAYASITCQVLHMQGSVLYSY